MNAGCAAHASRASEIGAHLALVAVATALLVAVGQPIITDDLWWHLGLGEAFAQRGPWLLEDPLLFTAPGPPDSAAWLADVAFFSLWSATGFTGLRVFHVLWVAAILTLAWSLLRRSSGSAAVASSGTLIFVALAAYRLVQLRPELFTILATLALYRLLGEGNAIPGFRRICAAALLFALWANCHAGFPLGLVVLGAAALGLLVASARGRATDRTLHGTRAMRLGIALCACTAASLLNPKGVGAYLAWLRAGRATPALARVADEWARVDLLRLPVGDLPPSPLAFALVWALLALAAGAGWSALRRRRAGAAATPDGVGPVLLTWALVSFAAMLTAVRFLWLGFFPWLALAHQARLPRRAMASAVAAVPLAATFFLLGDWRMISGVLPRSFAGYARPYDPAKYYAHATWFLVDAGVEGNVFNDYPFAGFLGFFGAPKLRTFVNGSLNVTQDAIEANLPIRERRGALPGESFLALLERMRIDVFVGTRLPQVGPAHRPWFYTTAQLERAPGWLCVFRNVDSAVYLRLDARNRPNFERVAAWYARERVPFDLERGFEPERVIRGNRLFAVTHGLVPLDFVELTAAARSADPELRRAAAARLASLYASLGLYERAIRLDRTSLAARPADVPPHRRVVWSLLRLGRFEEAREEAEALLAQALPEDRLSLGIAETARDAAAGGDSELRASRIATLPVLTRAEVPWVLALIGGAESRSLRGVTREDRPESASSLPASVGKGAQEP